MFSSQLHHHQYQDGYWEVICICHANRQETKVPQVILFMRGSYSRCVSKADSAIEHFGFALKTPAKHLKSYSTLDSRQMGTGLSFELDLDVDAIDSLLLWPTHILYTDKYHTKNESVCLSRQLMIHRTASFIFDFLPNLGVLVCQPNFYPNKM